MRRIAWLSLARISNAFLHVQPNCQRTIFLKPHNVNLAFHPLSIDRTEIYLQTAPCATIRSRPPCLQAPLSYTFHQGVLLTALFAKIFFIGARKSALFNTQKMPAHQDRFLGDSSKYGSKSHRNGCDARPTHESLIAFKEQDLKHFSELTTASDSCSICLCLKRKTLTL